MIQFLSEAIVGCSIVCRKNKELLGRKNKEMMQRFENKTMSVFREKGLEIGYEHKSPNTP